VETLARPADQSCPSQAPGRRRPARAASRPTRPTAPRIEAKAPTYDPVDPDVLGGDRHGSPPIPRRLPPAAG